AAAVVYVIGNLMLGALRLPPAGTLSTVQLIAWLPVLFITFLASIYVLLKIPSLTNHIFSGTAGGSYAGLLDAPAAFSRWRGARAHRPPDHPPLPELSPARDPH